MSEVVQVQNNYDLWTCIFQTVNLMSRARKKELKQYDCTFINASTLRAICQLKEKATPSRLSQLLSREPHTVLACLDKLENLGLVMRSRSLEKKNMVKITLTPSGQALCQRIQEQESINQMCAHLTERDKRSLVRIMTKIQKSAMIYLDNETRLPVDVFDELEKMSAQV